MSKDPKISDFKISKLSKLHYIKWDELEKVMGKKLNKIFIHWMRGQTSLPEGVYIWDLERFLKGGSSFRL